MLAAAFAVTAGLTACGGAAKKRKRQCKGGVFKSRHPSGDDDEVV